MHNDLPIIPALDVASHLLLTTGTTDCALTKIPTAYSFPAYIPIHCFLQKMTKELSIRHIASQTINQLYIYWTETPRLLPITVSSFLPLLFCPCGISHFEAT